MSEKQKKRLALFPGFMILLGLSLIGFALFLWSIKLAVLYFGIVCIYLGVCVSTALRDKEKKE